VSNGARRCGRSDAAVSREKPGGSRASKFAVGLFLPKHHLRHNAISGHNTRHETVNHSLDEYVRGDVHTNGFEDVWGLFKRAVVGTSHHMSVKHLDAYLDELEWRFNNRANPYLFRDTIKKLIESNPVVFSELIA
jgi:hypothetical protein